MASTRAALRRLGFGGAKLGSNPVTDDAALTTALRLGVRIFDTSPNYGENGASEIAIGDALRKTTSISRGEVEIFTKYGYYIAPEGKPLYDSVAVGHTGIYHSMHPEVMRLELQASLKRLKTDYVDTLFVHNPEHHVADMLLKAEIEEGGKPDRGRVEEEKGKMRERLVKAFIGLEDMVSEGKIKSYGVSSNGFALSSSEPLYVPLTDIL